MDRSVCCNSSVVTGTCFHQYGPAALYNYLQLNKIKVLEHFIYFLYIAIYKAYISLYVVMYCSVCLANECWLYCVSVFHPNSHLSAPWSFVDFVSYYISFFFFFFFFFFTWVIGYLLRKHNHQQKCGLPFVVMGWTEGRTDIFYYKLQKTIKRMLGYFWLQVVHEIHFFPNHQWFLHLQETFYWKQFSTGSSKANNSFCQLQFILGKKTQWVSPWNLRVITKGSGALLD